MAPTADQWDMLGATMNTENNVSYVLGHTDRELDRLDLQGLIYREITEQTFAEAGLGEGMRVLDIGCGSGDVSRSAARLVGPSGSVLGVDRDADTVSRTTARAEADGVTNLEFRVADLGDDLEAGTFDALVGRFILMHQEDPAAVLRQCASVVRPGGIVAMVESHMTTLMEGPHSMPFSPYFDKLVQWKGAVVAGAGADLESGLRLGETYVAAGLPRPMMQLRGRVEGGPESPVYRYMADSCRSMLPAATEHGVTGLDEAEIDQIEDRLRQEAEATEGSYVVWPVVTAWCRTASAV
ncbi:MAG: class I SAM-dependent methyltransferase [Longimicrobiales bacterium]